MVCKKVIKCDVIIELSGKKEVFFIIVILPWSIFQVKITDVIPCEKRTILLQSTHLASGKEQMYIGDQSHAELMRYLLPNVALKLEIFKFF